MAWYYSLHDGYTDFFLDSWVEISSQPSSSSLSSINDEIVTTGLRVQHDSRHRRRRTLRPAAPTHLNISNGRPSSAGGTSSQEEYEESESESDRVMTSSSEGLAQPAQFSSPAPPSSASESEGRAAERDDDDQRTAINHPINNDHCFTPQPNAFSHPPNFQNRAVSQPASVPGSYFPHTSSRTASRNATRLSLPVQQGNTERQQHSPFSHANNAAADHDAALRASLSTLLSCAAAARGLPKSQQQRQSNAQPARASNRIDMTSLRLVPESGLPVISPPQEPLFKPTIRRTSTSTSISSADRKENKRKAVTNAAPIRSSSKDRRAFKKARRSSSSEELHISPTLLTWVVSAGVVVFLSALSFSAGYSLGKEAGKLEATGLAGNEEIRGCAREAGRSSLGLRRAVARSAVRA